MLPFEVKALRVFILSRFKYILVNVVQRKSHGGREVTFDV